MPTIQSASERERAASSSCANSSAGRSDASASFIAALVIEFSHSRLTGFLRFGLLVQVGEDQLPLAAGVAGVDDLLDVLAAELFGDHRHLLARALVAHDELEALGHDRQVGHAPALVLGVVRVGLGELHEVPDRPRDHVLGTLEEALALLEGPRQHAREVLPDGGLLGDQQRLGHGGQRSGWPRRRATPRGPQPGRARRPCSTLARLPARTPAHRVERSAATVSLATP